MLQRFKLFGAIVPSRRCLRCNGLLEPVSKGEVLHRLEPKTRQYYHEFAICRTCDRVYWKGSHYQHLQRRLEGLRRRLGLPRHGPVITL